MAFFIPDQIKNIPTEKIDKAISDLVPGNFFHTQPRDHQKRIFLLCTYKRRLAIFAGTGLGKTKILLDTIHLLLMNGSIRGCLVVLPGILTKQSWLEQIRIHRPELTVTEKVGPKKSLLLLTAQGMIKQSMKDIHALGYDALIIDESTVVKNQQSKVSKNCLKFSRMCKACFLMTGTPYGRRIEDIWHQMKIVDNGKSLGGSIYHFYAKYFTSKKVYYGQKAIKEYTLVDDGVDSIRSAIRPHSIVYTASECYDVPKVIEKKTVFTLTEKEGNAYARARTGMNISTMRTACSGFLYPKINNEEDDLIRANWLEPMPSRLNALLLMMREFEEKDKTIIFCEFKSSTARVSLALEAAGISSVILNKKTRSILSDDPVTWPRAIIANSKSASFGLNLQEANKVVFYETPCCPIIRQQAEARCIRMGQLSKNVYIYDLQAENTFDKVALAYTKKGKDLLKEIIRAKRKGIDLLQ